MWQHARFALVMIALLAASSAAHAQSAAIEDLDRPIAPDSSITFRKLVTNVFRGATEDSSGHLTTASDKTLREIGTKERTVLPAGSPLVSVAALRVRGDGRTWLVLLIGAESGDIPIPGGGAAVVAVFPEGSAEAQDVVGVKEDVFCSFGEPGTIAIGPDDAIVIENSHSNSSQGYLITTLLHIRGGRLHRIDSIFTLGARSTCGRSFDESLTWKVEKDAGSARPKIVASVTLSPAEDSDDDCEEGIAPVKLHTFHRTYRFSTKSNRYEPAEGDMQLLEKFNDENL